MDSQELQTIELEPGERITLQALPQDDLRSTLGGSLDYTWASDDEAGSRDRVGGPRRVGGDRGGRTGHRDP